MGEFVPTNRSLLDLVSGLSGLHGPLPPADVPIDHIAADSRRIGRGGLFVAVPGTRVDGRSFAGEAVSRGAAAVVAESEVATPGGTPVVLVRNARRALAELAGAWHGHPGRRLTLVGITGTFGKTSVLSMVEAIMVQAGAPIGVMGSEIIGIRVHGRISERTRLTTPDPLALHGGLARIEASGARFAAMEVTSQALVQERIHGLTLALGIFTNLRPLEHLETHGTFRRYAAAKRRFFDHLAPAAPLVYPAGERAVRQLARQHDVSPIACGAGGSADRVPIRVTRRWLNGVRTEVTVAVRRPLERLDGGRVEPTTIRIPLQLLGRTHTTNAGLAATAALFMGAEPATVRDALAEFRPPRRRMQLVRLGGFTMLDDTATHPESLNGTLEVAASLPHRRLHVIAAIRGRRGPELNRRFAETLAIWSRKLRFGSLTATLSEDLVGDSDRVTPAELNAFREPLAGAEFPCCVERRLDTAVATALGHVRESDLLLLLGAQGMDTGARLVRARLSERRGPGEPGGGRGQAG